MSMFSQVNGPDLARKRKNERSNHVIKKGEPHAAFTLEFINSKYKGKQFKV